MMPQVEHKPADSIQVLKVARLWLRIVKFQVGHHEDSLMRMWKKYLKWSTRKDDVQLTMLVPF